MRKARGQGGPESETEMTKDTTNTVISWKTTRLDHDTIAEIVERAERTARRHRLPFDRVSASMDIAAVHCNGCPLRLEEFRDAEDFDFAHDFFGIQRHIDRTTGRLSNHFLPRFARPEGRQS
jgi:hypothetical protein